MHLRNAMAPAVVILSVPLLASCNGHVAEAKAAPQEPVVHVSTVQAAERSVPRNIRLTGSLEANRESDVAADASGRVAATFVERGGYVKRGALLARLDARSASIAAAQAKADAEAARADARFRETELERTEKLIAQKAVPQAELDRARSAKESAEQHASSAEAKLALQAKSIGDASIRAPFDGIIAERWIDEGEYVRPDSKVVTLVDIDTLRLKLTVPEAGVGAIKEGQHVAFTVASDPGASYEAEVRYIGPQLRQSSRDLVVEAVVDNKGRKLKPGMFATAGVEAGQMTAVLVPAAAIKSEGAVKHVFALVGQRLEERVIQAGDRVGDDIVVVTGVHGGDKVVSPITPELRDGLRAE